MSAEKQPAAARPAGESKSTIQDYCARVVSASFFRELFSDAPGPDRRIGIFTLPDKRTRQFAEVDEAAGYVAGLEEAFFGVGLIGGRRLGRPSAKDIVALPGLWLDIDCQAPYRRRGDLPADLADARRLLDRLPLAPSLLVDSGHGLHAYWLFREVWTFEADGERQAAAALARGWVRLAQAQAQALGWTIDPVGDLPRVLRVLGTVNRKGGTARPVRVLERSGLRYNPDDFQPFIDSGQEDSEAVNIEITGDHTEVGGDDGGAYSPHEPEPISSELPEIRAAICRCLPSGPGQRHRKLFDLARWMRRLRPDATLGQLRPVLRCWYTRALPIMRTKDWEDSWRDFADAWARVRHPAGESALDEAIRRAAESNEPVPGLDPFSGPEVELLAKVCRELARMHPKGEFWLSSTDAGRLLGRTRGRAWKVLHCFCLDGILELVQPGDRKRRRANRYRWIAGHDGEGKI